MMLYLINAYYSPTSTEYLRLIQNDNWVFKNLDDITYASDITASIYQQKCEQIS